MQRKRPLHGKIFARCIPKRLFAGHFGCMARISCQSQLILDTRRRYAATNWRFSRLRPLSGYMERKTCHGLPPGNAFREHFAIGKHPGTHRGEILPRQGTRERTARVYCHCQSGQERIRAQSYHRRTPGERISRAFCHRQAPGNAYSQRLANGAASSCGWAYCLAIALVPHESDDLFVQAVLCTRERGATSCAWRRHIVAMAGNRTEGRGTLSRTWRGALNAGIRAEGADDKLAHAPRPNRLTPFAQADLRPLHESTVT